MCALFRQPGLVLDRGLPGALDRPGASQWERHGQDHHGAEGQYRLFRLRQSLQHGRGGALKPPGQRHHQKVS